MGWGALIKTATTRERHSKDFPDRGEARGVGGGGVYSILRMSVVVWRPGGGGGEVQAYYQYVLMYQHIQFSEPMINLNAIDSRIFYTRYLVLICCVPR